MDNLDKSESELPSYSKSDIAHLAIQGAIQAIPFAGGAINEVFKAVIAPSIQKRRDEWLESLYKELLLLSEQVDNLTLSKLKDNELFIDILIEASQQAIKTSHVEKHEALKQAVLNTVKGSTLSEDYQHIFIQYIGELTLSHIQIIKYFSNPIKFIPQGSPKYTMGGISTYFELAFPDYKGNSSFFNLIIDDLHRKNILTINSDRMNITMSVDGLLEPRVSSFGKLFIEFISKSN